MSKSIFKFVHTTASKVFIIIMTAIFGLCAVKNVLTLLGAFGWTSFNMILDIVGTALCVFLIIFLLLIYFKSKYVVTNSCLYVKLGMIFYKIPCGLISSIVKIKADGTIFILYTSQSAKPSQLKINIESDALDAFIDSIRTLNSNVVYEIFDPSEIKK